MLRFTLSVVVLACTLSSAAKAGTLHAGDIILEVIDGQIVTGQIAQDQTVTPGVRVFAASFGDSGLDGFTSNPGFDALPGTFPTSTAIGFNALAGWKVWTGDGFESAGGEQLRIAFGPLNVIVADKPVAGFELAVQSNGGWHRHYAYTILGSGDDPPQPGIYLLELELYSTSPAIEPSAPFWKVFNYNDATSEHVAAVEWVQENLLGPLCPADLNGDGQVDVFDLLVLLGAWGECPPQENCPADLTGDGAIDVFDLLVLLGSWGACP